MDKEDNHSASFSGNFPGIDHSLHPHPHQQLMEPLIIGETSGDNSNQMVDYMPNNPQNHHHHTSFGFPGSTSDLHKLSFVDDGIQFADFGPKLALSHTEISQDETGLVDPVYFLKFPVLNDKLEDEPLMGPPPPPHPQGVGENVEDGFREEKGDNKREDGEGRGLEKTNSVQLGIVIGENIQKSKRKRQRSMKTSEEVECQRMTHIAVERNRRKQMNEHLHVLRSLMPGSYVHRGDQASIVGGAIEFVRELEQLLQCLESQKRRRLYGGGGDSSLATAQPHNQQPFLPSDHHQLIKPVDFDSGLEEETAESKSCLADIEVKMLGFDAMIKILSRRRPAQLINTIAALEDLHLTIVHTNITTIEQTVLYSFNVKVASEGRFTAEDIASSVQQIFSYIHANSSI